MNYEDLQRQSFKNDINEIKIRAEEEFRYHIEKFEGFGKIERKIEELEGKLEGLQYQIGEIKFTEEELIKKVSKQVYAIIIKRVIDISNEFLEDY